MARVSEALGEVAGQGLYSLGGAYIAPLGLVEDPERVPARLQLQRLQLRDLRIREERLAREASRRCVLLAAVLLVLEDALEMNRLLGGTQQHQRSL